MRIVLSKVMQDHIENESVAAVSADAALARFKSLSRMSCRRQRDISSRRQRVTKHFTTQNTLDVEQMYSKYKC